jgi:hypothetical protein
LLPLLATPKPIPGAFVFVFANLLFATILSLERPALYLRRGLGLAALSGVG